jgi:hypothetical protein
MSDQPSTCAGACAAAHPFFDQPDLEEFIEKLKSFPEMKYHELVGDYIGLAARAVVRGDTTTLTLNNVNNVKGTRMLRVRTANGSTMAVKYTAKFYLEQEVTIVPYDEDGDDEKIVVNSDE